MKGSINVRYNVYAPKAEQNSVNQLKRAAQTVYPLGSKFKMAAQHELLTRADVFTHWWDRHVSTKQSCEIQCEELAFSEQHKWLSDFKAGWNSADKQEKYCVQWYSQKAFQSTSRHHLPWIYCSNTNRAMVLCQTCGIFILNFNVI